MEHKLILGGEQYLPFARSRITALRATGLRYASQQFEVDGVSIKVRIEGKHEYIRLEGGFPGTYLVTPVSTPHSSGDGDPVTATITMGTKFKVAENVEPPAYFTDWQGSKKDVALYNTGLLSRYILHPSNSVPMANILGTTHFHVNDEDITAPVSWVHGVGVAYFEGVRAIIFAAIVNENTVRFYAKTQGAPYLVGTVTCGETEFFRAPWIFSGSGKRAISKKQLRAFPGVTLTFAEYPRAESTAVEATFSMTAGIVEMASGSVGSFGEMTFTQSGSLTTTETPPPSPTRTDTNTGESKTVLKYLAGHEYIGNEPVPVFMQAQRDTVQSSVDTAYIESGANISGSSSVLHKNTLSAWLGEDIFAVFVDDKDEYTLSSTKLAGVEQTTTTYNTTYPRILHLDGRRKSASVMWHRFVYLSVTGQTPTNQVEIGTRIIANQNVLAERISRPLSSASASITGWLQGNAFGPAPNAFYQYKIEPGDIPLKNWTFYAHAPGRFYASRASGQHVFSHSSSYQATGYLSDGNGTYGGGITEPLTLVKSKNGELDVLTEFTLGPEAGFKLLDINMVPQPKGK